jgi:ADP-heptose:LPS heptosyltransferase
VTLAGLLLRDPNVSVIVTGSEKEKEFSAAFSTLAAPRLVDLVGKLSVRQLMAVIASSSLVVSASTGPMHLAAGLRVPTVSMFCRMSACSVELWGPQGNRSDTILPSTEYCATRCPGDPHICRFEGGIAAQEVFERIRAVLRS